ncbi:MAG: sigma-70 family RNA polymerase sigma factor [Cyanobacteria bacterium P01_F01_bin.3]
MDLTSVTGSTFSSTSTDVELIHGIAEQDVQALDCLYDRYGQLVYRIALRMLGNIEEAEDLTQDIFLKLWQRQDLYQPHRGALSSFLSVMTRSRAIDRMRSRTSHHRITQLWQATVETETNSNSPLQNLSRQEQIEVIQGALDHLSPAERQVLEIAYYKGLSQSEIAKQTELPLGTVKSRSRQALKKLRNALKHIL